MCSWSHEAVKRRLWYEGNASSLHEEGRNAKEVIDKARETISYKLGCLFAEVIFTSSGTEAANLAVIGAALGNEDPRRKRILFSAAEHHCVLHTAPLLSRLGYLVETIPVNAIAQVKLESLHQMMGDDVLLVAVMHANNELGTFNPVQDVSALCRNHGALFFCDAVQTFVNAERVSLNNTAAFPMHWVVDTLGADLVAVSGHKVLGPQGVGALYIRAGTKIKPILYGGGQERELRAGTENVAAIAGFDAAVSYLTSDMYSLPPGPDLTDNRAETRAAFLANLEIPNMRTTVPLDEKILPGHLHVRIPGVQAETMLILLDRMGISASSGAACSSGSIEPSHVLLACGFTAEEAKEGLRFTFGYETTIDEAKEAARRFNEAAARLTSGKLKS